MDSLGRSYPSQNFPLGSSMGGEYIDQSSEEIRESGEWIETEESEEISTVAEKSIGQEEIQLDPLAELDSEAIRPAALI